MPGSCRNGGGSLRRFEPPCGRGVIGRILSAGHFDISPCLRHRWHGDRSPWKRSRSGDHRPVTVAHATTVAKAETSSAQPPAIVERHSADGTVSLASRLNAARGGSDDERIRVVIPSNLRGKDMEQLPAANGIFYMFLAFRRREIGNERSFAETVTAQMRQRGTAQREHLCRLLEGRLTSPRDAPVVRVTEHGSARQSDRSSVIRPNSCSKVSRERAVWWLGISPSNGTPSAGPSAPGHSQPLCFRLRRSALVERDGRRTSLRSRGGRTLRRGPAEQNHRSHRGCRFGTVTVPTILAAGVAFAPTPGFGNRQGSMSIIAARYVGNTGSGWSDSACSSRSFTGSSVCCAARISVVRTMNVDVEIEVRTQTGDEVRSDDGASAVNGIQTWHAKVFGELAEGVQRHGDRQRSQPQRMEDGCPRHARTGPARRMSRSRSPMRPATPDTPGESYAEYPAAAANSASRRRDRR